MPPLTCGFDNGGEDKFCCSDTSFFPVPQIPQPPKFLSYNKWKYSCEDHTPKCQEWAKSHPDSCYPGHESYPFMRSACQKSCERCGSEVSNAVKDMKTSKINRLQKKKESQMYLKNHSFELF